MELTPLIEVSARDLSLEAAADIGEDDVAVFRQLVSFELTPTQERALVTPPQVYPRQRSVLGVHWHPEFVPMDLIRRRVAATFPESRLELVIPTQHNELMTYNGRHWGVEIDCYSRQFNRKVQLLIHMRQDRYERAGVLISMLAHTFRYRAAQLLEFLDTLVEPRWERRIQAAVAQTGADPDLVAFVRVHAARLRALLDAHESTTPPDAYKNKLVRNYFDSLRGSYHDQLIRRAQLFLRVVKKSVKKSFNLEYFYQTRQVIEETQALGAGVVVPHPEQFWPILMAEYEVDGYEVWNPHSHQYTEFLINVVNRQNRGRERADRPLLIFMGDDTHMGEKTRPVELQDPAKSNREIGVQPAWDDLAIRKSLLVANAARERVIDEYVNRLG